METETLAQPHWEAVTPETRRSDQLASQLPFIQRFYLAGGTGLAYFEDAEALPMPQMVAAPVVRVSGFEMKRFLERQAIEAGRKRLQDLWN